MIREEAGVNAGSRHGADAFRVTQVLHCYGYAMQRTSIPSALDFLFRALRCFQRLLVHHGGIALQLPIDSRDAIQHASGQFNGRDFPRLNATGDVAQAAVVEWFYHGLLSRWAALRNASF